MQRQGASSKNLSALNINPGYKKQVKVICPQLLSGVIVEGHEHQYDHQHCHSRNIRDFLIKKMTAVATKPPSYTPGQCFKKTKSLEQVLGGASNKN